MPREGVGSAVVSLRERTGSALASFNSPAACLTFKWAPQSYYRAKTILAPFDEAVSRTRAALKEQGFGVITEIDVKDTLKKKIDVDFRPYLILSACNPALAYKALKLEDKVWTMLPCNVIVQEVGPGQTEVTAIDPVASMQAIENAELLENGRAVRAKLEKTIQNL